MRASSIAICSGIPLAGQGHRKGRSFPDGAVHRDSSPMALDDLRHNVEPHAQAGDRLLLWISDPIEPFKNLVALLSWDAESLIADTDRDRLWGGAQGNLYRLPARSILHRIPDQLV